jgi:hypothetical protein
MKSDSSYVGITASPQPYKTRIWYSCFDVDRYLLWLRVTPGPLLQVDQARELVLVTRKKQPFRLLNRTPLTLFDYLDWG